MLPKHHKTSFFLKPGLFNNLSSFTELEKRTTTLATEKDREDVSGTALILLPHLQQASPLPQLPVLTCIHAHTASK